MNRRYVFTLNHWTQQEYDDIRKQATSCKYVIIGKEIGPKNGVPHLHVFIIYKNNVRVATARAQWPTRAADFSFARESSSACRKYCMKQGDFWESGEPPMDAGEKEKKRWEAAKRAAIDGNWDDIPADIYIRYIGNLKKIHAENQAIPTSIETLDFHWFYGPTGTGKSVTARRDNPNYYLKGINKWWDGYTGQDCVIIEEWSPMDQGAERAMGHYLKQWCDHHPFMAETKGGMKMIRPKKIIITSNYSMEECFLDKNNLDPLKRRFKIHHFNNFPNLAPPPSDSFWTVPTPPNQWQLFPPCSPTQTQ